MILNTVNNMQKYVRIVKVFPYFFKPYCTEATKTNMVFDLKNLKSGDQVSITRIISKEDIQNFAKLTADTNPIHLKSSKQIVHGALLNGLVSGVIGTKLPGPGTIVAEQVLKYPNPCYVGDSVKVTIEVISVRKIITCKYTCVANEEKVVLEGKAKLLTWRKYE